VWVRPAPEGTTSEQCTDQFEQWASPTAHDFSVDVGAKTESRAPFRGAVGGEASEVVIRSFHARIDTLFSRKSYAAAYAAYVMWPKTCTIFGVAVPDRDNPELAEQVRDRYVKDGFSRMERHAEAAPNP
jgi:hypothetical protein